MNGKELLKKELVRSSFIEAKNGIDNILKNELLIKNICEASELIKKVIENNSKVFSCGNGGSMCDAMHFAEELSGRFREDRKPLPAISISDPAFLTCAGNDYGYENIFSRFLEANANDGDILVAISTSGNSKNIINACNYSKNNNIKIISLTGRKNSKVSKIADIDICTPCGVYSDRIQEMHAIVIHILVELIESSLGFNLL